MSKKQVIKTLKRLQSGWPNDLWLFANGHALYLMQKKDGERQMTMNGGVDPSYTVERFDIPNDGGDW